jgi:membrane-bound lytic murein transglycosylase D
MNGIDDVSEIRPGLTLVVPTDKKPLPPLPCETTVVAVPDKDAAVPGKKRVFYRTLPTDSVSDVADFFKVKPTDLMRWNNLDAEARLASNMVIQIWVNTDFDTSQVALVPPSVVRVVTVGSDEFFDVVEARRGRARLHYVIKKGDDLAKIGKHYGLTVADLERINRFGAKKSPLVVGQSIVVYRALSADEKAKACKITPGGSDVKAAMPPETDPSFDAPVDAEPNDKPDQQLGPKIGPEAEPGHP